MCSEFESFHWLPAAGLNDTRVGILLHGKPKSVYANLPNIAGIIAATYPGASCGLIAQTSPVAPPRQEPFRQMNSTFRNREANPVAYSTTGSNQSLDSRTAIGLGIPDSPPNCDTRVAEIDADADADSEAESDTSQYFDSESEDIEGTEDGDDDDERRFGDGGHGEGGFAVDGENDTNMEPSPSPAFTQASAYAGITNTNKKPRRCKLSRKHYKPLGTQRSMNSPTVFALAMDIDMDAPAEDPDDYCNDSSADEDTDGYAYSTWFGGIYHPMWLGHATSSGKKRRDNSLEEGAGEGKAVEVGAVAELGERHIRLPSLSRRKRAWKASQGTPSSVGESEWSLTVNNPMPLPSGSTAGAMSSPPMSPAPIAATKQMHTAPRSTQTRHRQSPARALERRLENLRVEDPGRGTTVSKTTVGVVANDLRPRMSSDQHEKKRTRYQQITPFEVTSMEAIGGDVITPPILWDAGLEEPMSFRSSSVDGQWDAQEFVMSGIEVNMSSPMGGDMRLGVSGRAKDISRVMEGVGDLL